MNLDQFDLVVVGAGITGATVAYIAAHDYHQKVLVLEKKAFVGGMLHDERDQETGVLVQKYGMHYLYTDDKNVYKFLTKLADWAPFILRAKAELDGVPVASPFNFSSIDLLYSPEDAARMKRLLVEYFDYAMHISLMDMLKSDNEDISELAKKLMWKYVIPYTAKQRGVPKETLSGIVMEGQYFALSYHDQCRLNHYQMLPVKGYTTLIEKMLSDERITLELKADHRDYIHITKDGELKFPQGKKSIPVVYTGGLDELFGNRYGQLPYYSSEFRYQTTEEGVSAAPYTSYAQREYTAVTDCAMLCSNYSGRKTVLTYEYPLGKNRSQDIDVCVPALTKRTYKIYEKYRQLAEKTKGLYICGRLARYRFMSMAEAVLDAMSVINQLEFSDIDLVPESVRYKRPPELLLAPMDNIKRNSDIESDLIIGDLSRELPQLTVVIPTYKRPESLKRTLQSVWNQDIPKGSFDVLVVDNDPTPHNETQTYLEQTAPENLYYYKNRVNLGTYGNMNRCISLARTKWISMVHDDDVLLPNALRWAISSRDAINDPKLAVIIPRMIRAFSKEEIKSRMKEHGVIQEDVIEIRKRNLPHEKRRWMFYYRTLEDTRRRFWRISRFDCYMVPFLYPAASNGTLFDRDAMLSIGGFYEGYPLDDGNTFNRISKQYHVYLCGESWGIYSFYTADVTNARTALQFVDSHLQYRLYMEKRSFRCWLMGKLVRRGYYTDAVEGDVLFGLYTRGYNVKAENYRYYGKYRVGEKRKKWARRLQKCWELWILLRAKLFGKRISFDLVKRCNGEHFEHTRRVV